MLQIYMKHKNIFTWRHDGGSVQKSGESLDIKLLITFFYASRQHKVGISLLNVAMLIISHTGFENYVPVPSVNGRQQVCRLETANVHRV